MKHIRIVVILFFTISLIGCKSSKGVVKGTENLSASRIIKSHYNSHVDFETLAARLRVNYKDDDTNQNVTVSLRLEKDKTIWMSASLLGISLAKAKITPSQIQYYSKIDQTYFDGDFRFISELIGTELTFDQLQSVLLAEPLYDLKSGNYNAVAGAQNYLVVPKKQEKLFNLFFYINPGQFTLQQQRLAQDDDERVLTISYADYEAEKNGFFPGKIGLRAQENDKTTEINIEYRSLEFDEPVSFPFSIPEGYKEIKL
ncbi:DUF4292 domain-containing protein [Leeuwenhoekiella sp. A16]|uniref:DUF4292 domain-containing protein n=1 Tax=unclassified Leeuwenhoekiella TaxID=2615029 RepID=UPI003A7F9149